jgi:hypothetical protein
MRVYILGVPYEVERGYVIGKDLGSIDHVRQFITIDDDLEYDSVVETLLHEIMHGIEYAFDMDLDDKIISGLSRGLYSVLVDPQNDALWAAIAGSNEIMEDEIDVDDVADEVLEDHSGGSYPDRDGFLYWNPFESTQEGASQQRASRCEVENLSDAVGSPRWTDPESERSRISFADACRRKAEETGRTVVTTTEDYIPGSVSRRAGDPYW